MISCMAHKPETNTTPQYKIWAVHQGKVYDDKHINNGYYQSMCKKFHLETKPFQDAPFSAIVGFVLICKQEWIDQSHLKYDWVEGPMVQWLLESYEMEKPYKIRGKQGVWSITTEMLDAMFTDNPGLRGVLLSWLMKYQEHLKKFRVPDDLIARTVYRPWGTLIVKGYKRVENRACRIIWYVDKPNESRWPKQFVCRWHHESQWQQMGLCNCAKLQKTKDTSSKK